MKKIKNYIFEAMQSLDENNKFAKFFDIFIILLIIINVITLFIETFSISQTLHEIFDIFEIFSVIIFSIEYLLRVWTSDLIYPDKKPVLARIRYIFSFMALIDLLAILPFYLPLLIPFDLRVLRVLRAIRLLRLFKMNRYIDAFSVVGTVLKEKATQLISSAMLVSILILIASILMYNVENDDQAGVFTNAFDAVWWAISTLTTVGYGDIYPITPLGRFLAAILAILGIALVAVPTGIISSGFMELINKNSQNKKNEKHFCPYCGKKIE